MRGQTGYHRAEAIHRGVGILWVGLLMHGKTPNLPEIIRWVREA